MPQADTAVVAGAASVNKLSTAQPEQSEPIAIVGVGLRFPGDCDSLDEFGEFLHEGRSGIREIPQDRWDVEAFTPRARTTGARSRPLGAASSTGSTCSIPRSSTSRRRKRQFIDPQQRMVLETAWQALEQGNIDPSSLRRGNGRVQQALHRLIEEHDR